MEAAPTRGGVFMLPINCSELLPDNEPFVNFFEAVARGQADKDRNFSKRLFRVLSHREEIASSQDWASTQNPVDVLVRKTLCFYRQQKEPVKPITFDNPAIVRFLKQSLKDLEAKVEDAIFLSEFEREQRRHYEDLIHKNRRLIEGLRKEASKEANKTYKKIQKTAQRKARKQ
jgi:hypothetical protein